MSQDTTINAGPEGVHSPFPWRIDNWRATQLVDIADSTGANIAHLVKPCDARLMAAIHDFVKAAHMLLDWQEYGGDAPHMLTEACEQARFALEKARGTR